MRDDTGKRRPVKYEPSRVQTTASSNVRPQILLCSTSYQSLFGRDLAGVLHVLQAVAIRQFCSTIWKRVRRGRPAQVFDDLSSLVLLHVFIRLITCIRVMDVETHNGM